jgi:hypothetical protein
MAQKILRICAVLLAGMRAFTMAALATTNNAT